MSHVEYNNYTETCKVWLFVSNCIIKLLSQIGIKCDGEFTLQYSTHTVEISHFQIVVFILNSI